MLMERYYCAFLLLLLLLQLCTISMASFTSNITDQSALLAFKSAITSDPNNVFRDNNWTESTNFCNWVGVTCSPRRPRVTGLRLRSMGLIGTLSPHIGNLSFLNNFNIVNNSFHGNLIPELSHLRRLKDLGLDGNKFEGVIPATLHHCRNLEVISLQFNKLIGGIPEELSTLPHLRQLYLGRNNLTGIIPPSFGNMSRLERFGLELNQIHGNIPNDITRIPNLREINFQHNYLNGSIPPSLLNLTSLEDLLLAGNGLSGNLPATTGLWLPNIRTLYLYGNELSGNIPTYLSNSSMLTELDLSENQFSGIVPTSLGHIESLVKLNLGCNQLIIEPGSRELSFLTAFTRLRYLEILLIYSNPFHAILPESIGNFSSSLQMFYASDCQLIGQIPKGIGFLGSVIYFVLNHNHLSGTIPPTIKGMKRLQLLYLHANELEGSIPNEFCLLTSTGEINLENNKLSGPIPSCIGNLSNLQKLGLNYNSLNSSIPLSFWSLNSLVYFNLSFNSLSGSLDPNIKTSRSLESIDISSNRISGKIATTMGAFQSLRYLNLSGNSFLGPIPESFGNLITLDVLDLSHNNLSGVIPKSLKALSHLQYLNLSYNDLVGEIPSGGPFSNFTQQSFMENQALCGQNVSGFPPCNSHGTEKSKTKRWPYKYILPAIAAVVLVFVSILFMVQKNYCKNNVGTQNSVETFNPMVHQMISYQELGRATNNFSETNMIGVGGFGSVYKGILSDGTPIAVKILNLQREGAFKSFDVECQVLRTIRHRNLVKVISSCSNPQLRALILQYMPNGSLEKWLYFHTHSLDLLQSVNIMIDVALALEYLHHGQSEPVVHCDLKPSNVLLDEDMVAHVGDFGIAKILAANKDETQTSTLGTLGYIAPEYGAEGRVSTKGDIYSYGVMLLETFTRKRPTDEMFVGEFSLRQWVNASFPSKIMEVTDKGLFETEYGDNNHVNGSNIVAIMDLGLACTKDQPDERSDIKDVVVKLNKIKLKLLHN